MTLGHELQRVEHLNPQRRAFVFPGAAADEARRYYQNAPVPARAYASCLRDLKQLIHQPAVSPNAYAEDTADDLARS